MGRNSVKICLIILISLSITSVTIFYIQFDYLFARQSLLLSPPTKPKLILVWVPYFEFNLTSRIEVSVERCPVKCNVTGDHGLYKEAGAILIHARNFHWNVPPERNPAQVYIYLIQESPAHTPQTIRENFFNWSASYRRESTIYAPYGKIERNSESKIANWSKIAEEMKQTIRGKTRLAAWFVSNCETPSRREDYVRELGKHLQIDVFGKCSTEVKAPKIQAKNCSKTNETECHVMLERNYKFYLALENTVCPEYITEKVFERLLNLVVPIVFCRRCLDGILPKDSFIAADDFPSPKHLAEYLEFLDKNLTEYWKYFEWRKEYHSTSLSLYRPTRSDLGCSICKKLHEHYYIHPVPNVKHLYRWVLEDHGCLDKYGLQLKLSS